MVEARAIDSRRRLVLVRRDDREHLLLIGGANDVVVETGIAPQEPSSTGQNAAIGTHLARDDEDRQP